MQCTTHNNGCTCYSCRVRTLGEFAICSKLYMLGVIFPDGPLWREQRKFMTKTLRELGAGNVTEQHIWDEFASCEEHLRDQLAVRNAYVTKSDIFSSLAHSNSILEMSSSTVVPDFHTFFARPCLNIVWRLVCGRTFAYDDPGLLALIRSLEAFTMDQALGPMAGTAYLKFLPPFRETYRKMKGTTKWLPKSSSTFSLPEHMCVFKSFLSAFVDQERSTRMPHGSRGYVNAFLAAQERKVGTFFTDQQLIISVQVVWLSSSMVMRDYEACTLHSFITMLIACRTSSPGVPGRCPRHCLLPCCTSWRIRTSSEEFRMSLITFTPEVRKNDMQLMDERAVTIFWCIPGARDKNSLVGLDDRSSLPLTEATVMEAQRLGSVLPISPPRVTTKDIEFGTDLR